MSLCWAQVCLCHSRFQPRNVGFPPVASPEAIACSKPPCPGVFGCRILETDIGYSAIGLTECILSG